jgi:hypothetical protein
MNKWILNKQHFLQGITYNPETGIEDMFSVDPYKNIGYIQGGWANAALTPLAAGTLRMRNRNQIIIPDAELSDTASFLWFINTSSTVSGSTTIYKYNIDTTQVSASDTTRICEGLSMGGAVKLGSYIYTAGDYSEKSIGRITLTTLADSETYGTFANSTDYREGINFKDNAYFCDGDEIAEITLGGTVTTGVLDLEDGHQAVSLAPMGEWLAIGALCGTYNPSRGTPKGFYKSKLYFWDTYSASWDEDRSTKVDGRILKIINKKGRLYVFLQDKPDSYTINYFDGITIVPIKRITPKEGTNMVAPGNDAYDVKGDQIYWGSEFSGDTYARVLAYGQGDAEAPVALTNPHAINIPAAATITKINSVKWGTPNELYTSYLDSAGTSHIDVFKEANSYGAWNIITPNFSTGNQQMLQKFKMNFTPITSGHTMSFYYRIDNTSTWTTWATTSYAQLNENKNVYVNTDNLEFNTIQFKISKPASDDPLKIRSIEVDSLDIDRI